MKTETVAGGLVIGGLLAYIYYLLHRPSSTQTIIQKVPTTQTKTIANQSLANQLLSSGAEILAGIVGQLIPNLVFQAGNVLTTATGGVVQGTQQIGQGTSTTISQTQLPGSGTVATGIESSTQVGGSVVQNATGKVVNVTTDLANSGALPVIVYGVSKVLASGFRGASTTQQKAILGQQTVAGIQMVASFVPGIGMVLSPVIGALASTKVGTKVVANVATSEEQVYTQAKKSPVSVGAGAAAGAAYGSVVPVLGTAIGAAVGALAAVVASGAFEGGADHQQRIQNLAQLIQQRVAQLIQNGDTLTTNDISGFQEGKIYGIRYVTVGKTTYDLSKLDLTKVGTNPFGITGDPTPAAVAYYKSKGISPIPPRARANKQGGLPTKYGSQYVFNPDQPNIIYSVPLVPSMQFIPTVLSGAGYVLPSNAGLPVQIATWAWPQKGAAPWPGLPGTSP